MKLLPNSTLVADSDAAAALFGKIVFMYELNSHLTTVLMVPRSNGPKVPASFRPKVPGSQGPRYLKVTFKYELDSKEGPSCLLSFLI